ncbi:CPBP family intramembrane metalloprotease domain-containing protein [Brachybacterium endophyticum]|uniref:CPBP family intramembrane metalloprotease domain-containing protein n=1 Tax=Brachybacterium endophyticum TaxID=2182385 RepID=A0A2U2RJL5_9MICO|nr:type II CAAX endopeptidase family protein [Brachybacterium endophyticum]PWH06067.1 CPBP family intramembrane metalloprotease domain-containing protein [Brachybacterium endophyticum]
MSTQIPDPTHHLTPVDRTPVDGAPDDRTPVDRSDRRRWLQLLLGIILFFVAEFALVIPMILWSALAQVDVVAGPAPSWTMLAGGCFGALVALGGFRLIVGPIGRSPGLALRGRGKLAELATGLVIGTLLISISVGLIALLGGYQVSGFSPSPQLLVPLALGVGAGFVEEILFRGILVRIFDAWLGSWAALALTSVLFGLMHLTNQGASLTSALGLVIEAGVLLGAAYLLTRRLWLAIGIHIAWNTVQAGVYSSDVSGTGAQHGLLAAQQDGPAWLTGGSMGVEGSLVTVLVGLVAGVIMLVLAVRRGHMLPRVAAEGRAAGRAGRRHPERVGA